MSKTKTKKFVSGWIIVLGCMLIQAIPFSVAANIQPQFMDYVVKGEGFSLAGFSLIFTLGTIASAIASPIIGKLYSKINAKILLISGAILSGGGFIFFSIADRLWQFYLIAAIVQIGTATLSSIGVPLLINSWFSNEVKGKAMGLAFAGGSIGNIFLQQMVVLSLTNYGYRKSYVIYGLASLIVGLIVSIIILRLPTKDDQIIKSKNDAIREVAVTNTEEINYSIGQVKNIKYFWWYCIGFILIGLYVSAISVQYPMYLKSSVGIAPKLVGTVGALISIFALIGNLLGGVLFDKLGVTKCLSAASIFASLACVFLIATEMAQKFAFVFPIFIGLSIFSYVMGPAYITGAHFGKKDYGAILGIINLMFAVGFSLGSTLFGLIIQTVGYGAGWFIILIVTIIAYTLLISASRGMTRLNKKA